VQKKKKFIIKENTKNFNIKFWLWFEIVISFKNKTLNLQGIKTFSKINFYSNYNNLQKQLFKNSFVWKSYFWAKGHAILFWSNVVCFFLFISTPLNFIEENSYHLHSPDFTFTKRLNKNKSNDKNSINSLKTTNKQPKFL